MITLVFTDSGNLLAQGIKLLTWSEYAHVSFLMGDMVLDSTLKRSGVRRYPFEELKHGAKRILVKEYPRISDNALNYAASQIGKPYDWTAIFGMPIRRDWQQDDSWFCSELVAWACMKAGTPIVDKESWRITPQDELQAT